MLGQRRACTGKSIVLLSFSARTAEFRFKIGCFSPVYRLFSPLHFPAAGFLYSRVLLSKQIRHSFENVLRL